MSALGDLQWMLPPLAICLVLTGIHGYLGIHVLARKVIFVDLALAQIAALGSVCAVLLGYDARLPADGPAVYLFSLGFTLVGAAVFALTRMRREKVPQEAFIGIAYAVASALAILLLARSPGEGEHIKEMLVGNVLLVTWPTVIKTAIIYGAIGLFHFLLRKPFFEISTDHDAAVAAGRRVVLWDFAFYASFGLVITSSVAVAGVLLVFSFLVVPAVIAFLWSTTLRTRIGLAWAVGVACSGVGMVLSYYGDLPTGPSVVACFAALLILSALTHHVVASQRRSMALLRVLAGAAAVATVGLLLPHARKPPVEHSHQSEFQIHSAALAGDDESAQIDAIHHLAVDKDPHAVALLVQALSRSSSDRVIEHSLGALPEFGEV
ncbi:MAG TPA: iron chelate uptake ABC transporter family permease subunit, partial [Polyangia bacterium]